MAAEAPSEAPSSLSTLHGSRSPFLSLNVLSLNDGESNLNAAAYFAGQYYGILTFNRQSISIFYGPQSSIDFDGIHYSGENAIALMHNESGHSHHDVTVVSSFVEPVMGVLIATFMGRYTLAGQERMFNQMFILKETGARIVRRITYSLFRTLPSPPADLLVRPADPHVPLAPLMPPALPNGPVAPRARALLNGTATQSSGSGFIN